MSEEIIIPAIAEDGSLFPIEKMEAHRIAQHHLAISAFVFSGSKLLIQQRAKSKYHCPGQWANTCCTHPHWQESPEDAAHRRVQEELGISVSLKPTTVIDYKADVGGGLTEHERVHVFIGEAEEASLEARLNPDEVESIRWVEVADLPRMLEKEHESLCPWFAIYISRWDELKLRH